MKLRVESQRMITKGYDAGNSIVSRVFVNREAAIRRTLKDCLWPQAYQPVCPWPWLPSRRGCE